MSFLKRLFGSGADKTPVEAPPSDADENIKLANDPVPVRFAEWVNKYLILSQSFENDLSLAPDEEQCQRLKISDKERRLCANENVLLRALGACMFVRNNLDEKYYLTFRESLMPQVIERMKRNSPHMHHDNPSEALDQYLEDLKSDSHVSFSMTYLNRVYPETPNSESIFMQGIPVHLGFKYALNSYEITQDAYSMLKFGVSYETLKKLHNLSDETQ